ncbi:MAG: hypothetical protein JWQ23_4209 [Herminiimonas sp.]|nr:hypothetical protein [Herminiimonas sp.]
MALFSFLRKNKQETGAGERPFQSRAEDESQAVRNRGKRKSGKQGNQAVDPVLPEKKRARRRLVGAIALVLAAVIGLPMFLDSEPKPLADDIAIDIPSRDRKLPAGARTPVPPAADAKIPPTAALDKNEELIEAPGADAASSKAEGRQGLSGKSVVKHESVKQEPARQEAAKPDTVKPESVKPESTRLEAAKQETQAEARRTAKTESESRSAAPAADKATESARARALLEGKSDGEADKADKKPSKFIIQVAALATQDKVDELQGKLKSAGIKSYTQKVVTDTGGRTRIRVGPFGSKEEAEKVRARLVKLGLSGTLVPA